MPQFPFSFQSAKIMVDLWANTQYIKSTTKEHTMKHYKFVMDCAAVYHVVARDFRSACLAWERFGLDPRDIAAVEVR